MPTNDVLRDRLAAIQARLLHRFKPGHVLGPTECGEFRELLAALDGDARTQATRRDRGEGAAMTCKNCKTIPVGSPFGGYAGHTEVQPCPYHANAPALVAELAAFIANLREYRESDLFTLEVAPLLTRAATYKEPK